MTTFDYSDEQINALIIAIASGRVSLSTLPVKLYEATANVLKEALYKGYGSTLIDFEFGSTDYKLLNELRTNVYIFSAAKTATQVHEINSLMVQDEEVLTMAEFKKHARAKFNVYNGKDGYLESEFITAQTTASSAINYKESLAEIDTFPTLTSVAIIDKYTAEECVRMNGVTARSDSQIWRHNLAPRHWRCRCHEEKNDKYSHVTETAPSKIKNIISENDKSMDEVFKFNPVIDKILFSDRHPYYHIGKKYPSLAKNNWGLPIPKHD